MSGTRVESLVMMQRKGKGIKVGSGYIYLYICYLYMYIAKGFLLSKDPFICNSKVLQNSLLSDYVTFISDNRIFISSKYFEMCVIIALMVHLYFVLLNHYSN